MNKRQLEKEINLLDLFWAVCLKWRVILSGAIVFALLLGGGNYIKSIKEIKKLPEKITSSDIKLNPDSLNETNVYLKYQEICDSQENYVNNSLLMQLDANNFYRSAISYFIDSNYTVEYPIISKTDNSVGIAQAYQTVLLDKNTIETIQKKLEINEISKQYCIELIDFENNYGYPTTIQNTSNYIMTISVYGQDEKSCKEIAEIIKNKIIESKGLVEEKFGLHELIFTGEENGYIANNYLLEYQNLNIDKLRTYTKTLEDLKNKLTAEEKRYIDIYNKEINSNFEIETNIQNSEVSNLSAINAKMIILGFIGGGAFLFIFYVLKYIFNSSLRLEDDFERIFGIRLFGHIIAYDTKKKRFFSFIDKIILDMRHFGKRYLDLPEAIMMIEAELKILAKKNNMKKIYITGSIFGDNEKKYAMKLKENLKKEGIEAIIGKSILNCGKALEELAETEYVLLFEVVDKSLYTKINETIDMSLKQGGKVIGAVVIG